MRVTVRGRVKVIQSFINTLQFNAHCVIENIDYPECWKFARASDYQSIIIEICGNYLDLDSVRSAKYTSLEVSGIGASFSFTKEKGSRNVALYQEPVVRSQKSCLAAKASESQVEQSGVILSDYDTMEVYEAKVHQMGAF